MTKAKAIKQMHEFSRSVMEVAFANKIAKAFGFTLKEIKVRPKMLREMYRFTPNEFLNPKIVGKIKGVSVYELARGIARKYNPDFEVKSPFYGAGKSAEYITEKSLDEIIGHIK